MRTGCDSQPLILSHVLTHIGQPEAAAKSKKGSGRFSRLSLFATYAALLLCFLLELVASWESKQPCTLKTSPAHWQSARERQRRNGEGLGKCSTPNSFVLFDLHLKYIWEAAETLTLNRLPTQMLSTKKLPGIIILSIYQFVTRIWHILSLKVRNNNFPP